MPWPLSCMPCSPRSQLNCRPCLENLCSLETCFSTSLFLPIGKPSLHRENNWSMIHCYMPTKSKSTVTTRLVIRFLSMTKCFMSNLKTFFGSILMALGQFYCCKVLQKVLLFATPCHIGSPHLCNIIWKSCFFLIYCREGECFAQLCLSHDSQETSCVDSHASFLGSW